jgi:hypothetical protein
LTGLLSVIFSDFLCQPIVGHDIGAKAGINLATLTDSDGNLKLGFHAGGFAEFTISDRIAIQPELLYSTQGVSFSVRRVDFDFNLNYINLPVLLKINIAEGLKAEVGTQVGFLLSSEFEAEESGQSASISLKKGTKSIDVSAVVGLSYTFAEKFVVGARYNLGFTKVYDNAKVAELLGDDIMGDSKSKNDVIQINLGYKF